MSLDFDATDTRTRRFRNAGNSCYINATLQALFAVPPVQRLYESSDFRAPLPGGHIRDDGRIDGDLCIASVYRDARSMTRMSEPMLPQILLDAFYYGMQDDASAFLHQLSDSHQCVAPRLLHLLQGRDRPVAKCSTCA